MANETKQSLLKERVADLIPNVGGQIEHARRILGQKEKDPSAWQTVALVFDVEGQMPHARKALQGNGDISAEDIRQEAERRAEMARSIMSLAKQRAKQAQKMLEKLEKPLGTKARPFPMWGSQRIEVEGRSSLEQVLSAIADNTHSMKVYSDRSYSEVMALAYCDMPVPSMLPLFFDGLERRAPDSTNRTQFMIGDPGHGKSFLGALQGRLRSDAPVEVLDCGGKNMRELLFEMVLDFGAGDSLPKAIDKRLAAGTLEPVSYGLLQELPSSVLSSDEGGKILSIDWNALKNSGTYNVRKAYDTLSKISKIEGLDNAGGNALGMNSQYGPLIRKWLAGEEIVLDEYNKSREGTDDNLQTIWQFFIGEIKECTVENPLKNKDNTSGPSEFTFRREDLKAGFFVTLTGNKKEDGITTRSLNKSVYSRLSPDTLPDPEVIDWQHRICQMMVGMPVSTLYATFKEKADAQPEEFGDWLLWLRREKAKIEGVAVPELQETLLRNWQQVINSSEKLARFYDKWAAMTDAEKITSSGYADLVDEVDEEYTKKEGIDFRKIKQHLEQAIPIRPRMVPFDEVIDIQFGKWDKPPKTDEKIEENTALAFGTRLIDFLERIVYEKTAAVGKVKLYNRLQKAMDEHGLREAYLMEGARSQQRSVEEDLNIRVFNDRDPEKRAELARKVFCSYLRQIDPDIKGGDDDIVTLRRMMDVLKQAGEKKTEETKEILFVNRDHETLSRQPLASATIQDTVIYNKQGKAELDFSQKDLVDHNDFLAALAMPTVSGKNLGAIWEQNVRPLTRGGNGAPTSSSSDAPPVAPKDQEEDLNMAENRSSYGIATTSIEVSYQDGNIFRVVPVHIVHSSSRNKTLVVSEKIPSRLAAAFKEAGIVHVNRNEVHARSKVESALNEMTRGMPSSVKGYLADAFKYRNEVDETKDKNKKIADLLIENGRHMILPKYAVKNRA